MKDKLESNVEEVAQTEALTRAEAACRLTLLFHSGGHWTGDRHAEWMRLMGIVHGRNVPIATEVTTRVLYKGYEIRTRHDAVLVHGQYLSASWVHAYDRLVVDKSAYNRGEYNKVVAHVTSVEAAEVVVRLLGRVCR